MHDFPPAVETSTSTLQLESPKAGTFYEEAEDLPPPPNQTTRGKGKNRSSLSDGDAAVIIQKAYRGFQTRAEFLYIPEYELRQMIRDLDAKEKGMFHCGYYVLFLFLYFAIIVIQRDMTLSHSIESALRDVTSNYASPTSVSDVFSYMQELVMGIYNGDELESPCNACPLMNDSSLGYVPVRYPELWECDPHQPNYTYVEKCELYAPCFSPQCSWFSPYSNSSVTYDGTIDLTVCGTEIGEYLMDSGITFNMYNKWNNASSRIGDHGWVGNKNKLLGGVALIFSLRAEETCSELSGEDMHDYFPTCYSNSETLDDLIDTSHLDPHFMIDEDIEFYPEADGYVVLFDSGLFNYGPKFTLCSIQEIKDADILGQNTDWMEIVFYTYNGEDDGLYSLAKLKYSFEKGGKVQSEQKIRAFPLRNMYQPMESTLDLDRMILEIIFAICVFCNLVFVIKDIWKDYVGKKTHRVMWNLVRLTSCLLFISQIIIWIRMVVWMDNFALTHVEVLNAKVIDHILANVGEMLSFMELDDVYNSFTVLNGMFALLVVFYTFKFHYQLSIVTDTLFHSLRHLLHFLVIFFVILILFSAIHWVLFGSADDNFKNLQDSLASLALVTFGAFDYYSMKAISNPLGPIVFFGYQMIITLLMLNILLSIVLNAYEVAKSLADEDQETIIETTINFIGRIHGRCRMLFCRVSAQFKTSGESRILPGASSPQEKYPDKPLLDQEDLQKGVAYGVETLKRKKTTKQMRTTKIPIKKALLILRNSPANNYTCFWYLKQYTEKRIVKRWNG